MDGLDIALDAAWIAGLVLALTRVATFALVFPLTRAVPMPGRLVAALGIALFLASPVEGALTIGSLIGAGVANALVGGGLGLLGGLALHAFGVAGGIVDIVSGVSVAAVIDPTRGEQGAVFSRLFHLTGLTLFAVLGGLEVMVWGLAASTELVPLSSTSVAGGADLASPATRLVSRLFLAGTELAIPVLAALFAVEVVLGIASRLAPQANVFLLGLPAKLLVALTLSSASLLLFPEATVGLTDIVREALGTGIAAFAG